MKILSLILSLMMIPSFAFASHAESFKAAIDEYAFNMTVEWDQKDKAFSEAQGKAFKAEFSSLLLKGLTASEIKAVLASYGQIPVGMDLELALLDTTDAKAVNAFFNAKMDQAYARGASWNGAASIAAPLIVIGLIVAIILMNNSSSNTGSDEDTTCYDYYGQCYRECPEGYEDVDWLQDPCYDVCPTYCM